MELVQLSLLEDVPPKHFQMSQGPNIYNASEAIKESVNPYSLIEKGLCPDCGSMLRYESGCKTCYNCGYSLCG